MSGLQSALDRYLDADKPLEAPKTSSELTRPTRKPLLDLTIESIGDALLHGLVKPGERIDEFKLVEELNVSRATIREAMRQLEQEGLLTRIPFRGTFARKLTKQELEEITDLRIGLEGFAAEQIINRGSAADIEQLSNSAESLSDFPVETDFDDALRAHLGFHRLLCQLSGNSFLLDAWTRLTFHVLRVMRMSQEFQAEHDSENTLTQAHLQIVDAIARGDVALARNLIREHVRLNIGSALRELSENVIEKT